MSYLPDAAVAEGSLTSSASDVYLSGVPGAPALAAAITRTPPNSCDNGVWTLGEVHGSL